jgi:hypothetical protein
MLYIANPVEVDAFKIVDVGKHDPGGMSVQIDSEPRMWRLVSAEMIARMTPKIGDYLVEQSDGYVYLNPKDVFERKYSPKPGQAQSA